jgi:cell division protein FtsB
MIASKRKIHSMNSRIWRMVIGILLLFLISITIINSVILKKSKEDFLLIN